MPVVVLGTVVSLGVVALSASRFGWRRSKAEKKAGDGEERVEETVPAPAEEPAPEPPARRFKPAPPGDADAPRWDTPPAELAAAAGGRAVMAGKAAAEADSAPVTAAKAPAKPITDSEASEPSNATAAPAADTPGETVTATKTQATPEPNAKPRKPRRRARPRVRPEPRSP